MRVAISKNHAEEIFNNSEYDVRVVARHDRNVLTVKEVYVSRNSEQFGENGVKEIGHLIGGDISGSIDYPNERLARLNLKSTKGDIKVILDRSSIRR